jgi:hypothetical protein
VPALPDARSAPMCTRPNAPAPSTRPSVMCSTFLHFGAVTFATQMIAPAAGPKATFSSGSTHTCAMIGSPEAL